MTRAFVAIELPEAIRRRIATLRPELTGARWVKPEQVHLTLRFIGEVSDEVLRRISTDLETIEQPRFSVRLGGAGVFPNRRAPRVLWIGLDAGEPLQRLKTAVDKAVALSDADAAGRPFRPHLTIARLKDARRAEVEASLRAFERIEWEPFDVEQLVLFSSVLAPGGATHRPERAYALR